MSLFKPFKPFVFLSIFLISPHIFASPKKTNDQKPSIKVGLIDNSDFRYLDGCGCGFYPPDKDPFVEGPHSQKFLLTSNDEKGWINIDNKVVELKKIKDGVRYDGKKGDKYQQFYRSGDLSVTLTCNATGFGDTHAVFCNAEITVTQGDQKQVVKAEGSCGC